MQSSGLAESCPPHAARQLGSPSMKPAPCLEPVTGAAAAPVPATKPTRWKPPSRCRTYVANTGRHGRPARPRRRTGRGWPQLAAPRTAPRCCPGHPMALGGPCSAPFYSSRALAGLCLHTEAVRRRHASRQVGQPGRAPMWRPAAQRRRPMRPPARPARARSSSGRPPAAASLPPRPASTSLGQLADTFTGRPAMPALFST